MPDAAKILQRIRSYGANVMLDGDRLEIVNRSRLPAAALIFIRENKAAICDFLDREAEIDERAAIMEHDGGAPREIAEPAARALASLPKALSEEDRKFAVDQIAHIVEDAFHRVSGYAEAA